MVCIGANIPSISFHMDLVNYSPSYFVSTSLSGDEKKKMEYLHFCVVNYLINIYDKTEVAEEIEPVIKDFNLKVKKGELIGIKGAVGAGKSSIFSCLLGEMKPVDYKLDSSEAKPLYFDYFDHINKNEKNDQFIKVYGRIAYCPQNSPIFSSSIRENICFYRPYEELKYNHIVDICCLLPDFAIMNAGDQTEVGGRGVTLSGGQRARIALARAIYNDSDIYFLDDPLSAVDAHVGLRIWNEAIIGYLIAQGKTVLIASHQTQYFKDCHRILTITHGKISKEVINNGIRYESSTTDFRSQNQANV